MKREELDRLWREPANWTLGLIYHCKDDPRLVVAKRQKWRGLTVNFSRPMAVPLIILTLAIAILPIKVARALSVLTPTNQHIILVVVVAVILSLWFYLAGRHDDN